VRSRADVLAALAVLVVMMVVPRHGAAQTSAATATRPDADAIARAIEIVKADPNLATDRTIRTLQWKRPPVASRSKMPRWILWIVEFFGWMAQVTRVLVWCVVVIAVAVLTAFIVRLVGASQASDATLEFVAPTHVRSLDIRPETLPTDVGAAARALWDAGEQRAALALLYRGLLSRLVHLHHVPIRASSTEGDCLSLAVRHLAPDRQPYVTHLVSVWQRAVYGHHQLDADTVYRLCDGFSFALDPIDVDSAARGGAA